MRWTACDCRAAYYARVKRSAWMRLAFGRKLYRCHACEAEMLLDPAAVSARLDADSSLGESVSPEAYLNTVVSPYRS